MINKYLILLLFILIGCGSKHIEAPMTVNINDRNFMFQESGYVPFVKWNVTVLGDIDYYYNVDFYKNQYSYGGVNAFFSYDNQSIRLDCSTNGAQIFICLADRGNFYASCEQMKFKINCQLY